MAGTDIKMPAHTGNRAAFDSATMLRDKRRWFRDARIILISSVEFGRADGIWSVNVTILDDLRIAGRSPADAVAELLRDIEND